MIRREENSSLRYELKENRIFKGVTYIAAQCSDRKQLHDTNFDALIISAIRFE